MINLLGPIQLLSQQDRETLERAARLLLRYEQTRPLVVPKIHSFTNQKQFSITGFTTREFAATQEEPQFVVQTSSTAGRR